MRWPLRYQILVPFAGIMLAVVLGVSLLDAYLAARRTQRQIERQLQEVAQTLLEANFPLTDAVLKQTKGLSGAEFVLVDSAGQLRASSLADVDLAAIPPVAAGGQAFSSGDSLTLADQAYFHSAVFVGRRGANAEPMSLHILYPQGVLREARWQASYPPLVVGTALLGLVIVLAIAIAGRLTRPILELRHELSRLVRGEFQPLRVPQRNDELRDLITSVNTLGDQLEELRGAIIRSERLTVLGQLTSGLAHQLRNSVAGARIAVQLHQRHCRRIDQESLGVALRQLTVTESHLQRFLTAGQPPKAPHRTRCDLQQVVADVISLTSPACKHRSVELQFDPRSSASRDLLADAEQLRQLVMNLVLNAIEAAGSGGWVRIELTHNEQVTTIRVSDSGVGPAPALVERLFEPFVTGKPEGIGLGLAVAKTIVESHAGRIRYVQDGATCFEVVLPFEALSPQAPAGQASLASAGVA